MRKKTSSERFREKIAIVGSCWLWTASADKDGYGWFDADGHRKAHRWSYAHHNGPIPAGMGVLHKCDTPSCVNPDHLFVGTSADNHDDQVRKNRQLRGETHGKTRLIGAQVLLIRQMYRDGHSLQDISEAFGITRTGVTHLAIGRRWGHIPGACERRAA